MPQDNERAVSRWLMGVFWMILAMVVVGGTTRLTGSGLSMVEWRPLMGTLPPLSEAEWLRVFARYQQTPQYSEVNAWMDLAAFQRIFFWEYVHRLLGRLIGVVFFVPWLYFLVRGRLTGRRKVQTLVALLMGGSQGLLGWYMVKSGLVDVPEVSHLRLAAHLLLATVVSQWVLWLVLEMRAPWRGEGDAPMGAGALGAAIGLLYGQIAYGAFMAGKRAGLLSNTFPDMNGRYLPGTFVSDEGVLHDLLHGPLLIHYTHRALAFVVVGVLTFVALRFIRRGGLDRHLGRLLAVAVWLQLLLGALTVLFSVPTAVAVAHQLWAILLLSVLTAMLHRVLSAQPTRAQPTRAQSTRA